MVLLDSVKLSWIKSDSPRTQTHTLKMTQTINYDCLCVKTSEKELGIVLRVHSARLQRMPLLKNNNSV